MNSRNGISRRSQDRLGTLTVGVVLALALVASYACGSGEPQVVAEEIEPPREYQVRPAAVERTVEVDPAVATDEPLPKDPAAPVFDGPIRFEDAETAFRERRFGDAVDLFTRYTGQQPDNVWGHYMLGLSRWKVEDRPGAVEAFERALEIDSGHVKSHLNLARVELEQGRPGEALEHIDRALARDPTSGEGFRLLGRASLALGDVEGATSAYRRALVFDEGDTWAMNNLGLLRLEQGAAEAAIGPLARASLLDDDQPVFRNNLGMALEHAGYFEEAAEAYRSALSLRPGYERAEANLKRIEGRKNRDGLGTLDLGERSDAFEAEVTGWREPPVGEVPGTSVDFGFEVGAEGDVGVDSGSEADSTVTIDTVAPVVHPDSVPRR